MKNVCFLICLLLAATGLSSLASASRFAQTCKTTSHLVSITDNPQTGELEYRSWQLEDGEVVRRKPDLFLTGGSPAGGGGNYGILFKNGDYSYILNVRYTPEDDYVRYLMVSKDNQVILAEVCFPY